MLVAAASRMDRHSRVAGRAAFGCQEAFHIVEITCVVLCSLCIKTAQRHGRVMETLRGGVGCRAEVFWDHTRKSEEENAATSRDTVREGAA